MAIVISSKSRGEKHTESVSQLVVKPTLTSHAYIHMRKKGIFPDLWLWYGLTDKAIDLLLEIPEQNIKNPKALEKLLAYLERNRPYIPCYAARKELGLCNSSAIGEKTNDLIVSLDEPVFNCLLLTI